MEVRKAINIAAYCILALMVVTIIALSAAVKAKNTKINNLKYEVEVVNSQCDSLMTLCTQLANMEAIHCEVTLEVKNTAVFGVNRNGDINLESKQLATYLRKEILDSLATR